MFLVPSTLIAQRLVVIELQIAMMLDRPPVPVDLHIYRPVVLAQAVEKPPVALRGEAIGNLHLPHLAHGLAILLVAHEHLCAHGFAADLPAVAFYLQSDPM